MRRITLLTIAIMLLPCLSHAKERGKSSAAPERTIESFLKGRDFRLFRAARTRLSPSQTAKPYTQAELAEALNRVLERPVRQRSKSVSQKEMTLLHAQRKETS